jgi:hypothetical protein
VTHGTVEDWSSLVSRSVGPLQGYLFNLSTITLHGISCSSFLLSVVDCTYSATFLQISRLSKEENQWEPGLRESEQPCPGQWEHLMWKALLVQVPRTALCMVIARKPKPNGYTCPVCRESITKNTIHLPHACTVSAVPAWRRLNKHAEVQLRILTWQNTPVHKMHQTKLLTARHHVVPRTRVHISKIPVAASSNFRHGKAIGLSRRNHASESDICIMRWGRAWCLAGREKESWPWVGKQTNRTAERQ